MADLKEFCGLFGVYGEDRAAAATFLGMYSLQHRGEESCGIVSYDGTTFNTHLGMGLVSEVFDDARLRGLSGRQAIGHVRYSTTGSSAIKNVQPLFIESQRHPFALAHNGNLVNAAGLRRDLEAKGAIFHTTTDSEIILHLIMRTKQVAFEDKVAVGLKKLKGAFSLLMMSREAMIGVRDPLGFRPLCVGRRGKAYFISSESCALDLIGATLVREVEPGEMVVIDQDGFKCRRYSPARKDHAFCAFEHVYFSRPDSIIFGDTVHMVRQKMGARLAHECPIQADCVIGVPDSGTSCAMGFAKESGIPLEFGIIRNHYIGRTFIQPYQEKREFSVKLKFNILKEVVRGKRVVIVDDSIVRGTTSRIRVSSLRDMGAKEVHMRVSCPPHRHGCFYGIDFPDPKKLIAYASTVKEIEKFLGVDSLGYLSLKEMLKCFSRPPCDYCTACWSGKYPVKFKKADKHGLEK